MKPHLVAVAAISNQIEGEKKEGKILTPCGHQLGSQGIVFN